MRLGLIAGAVVLAGHGALAEDGPAPLRPGPGMDLTVAACSVCHTPDYIVMNSRFLTAEQWQAEVTKMRVVFGESIDDATAAAIVGYLAAQYGMAGRK